MNLRLPRVSKQDLLASYVVVLVALPLCMGIAIASGMPPSAGLITSIVGGIVVGSISGSPLQVSGPAAGLTVLVWTIIDDHGPASIGPITLVGGLLQATAAVLGIGRYFRAISPAVVYGMLAGIGVLICTSQLQVMVGEQPLQSGLANLLAIPHALQTGLFDNGEGHRAAFGLGVLTVVAIVVWNRFRPARLQGVPGALVGVLLAVAAAAVLGAKVNYVSIPSSLWSSLQPISLSAIGEVIGDRSRLIAAVGLAAIASAETLLCASAVDRMQEHVRTDYNRELLAQGVGNAITGALGALPMTGVIVRSSANVAAGATSRMSSILHGVWILAIAMLVPGLLRLIPTASLAAVLVHTGYKLVSAQQMRELRQFGWGSLAIYGVTLGAVVLTDLLTGVLLGLALALVRLLFTLGLFELEVDDQHAPASRVDLHLRGALTFVGLPRLASILERVPSVRDIYLHVTEVNFIDHACLVEIDDYIRKQRSLGVQVVVDWPALEMRSEKVQCDDQVA